MRLGSHKCKKKNLLQTEQPKLLKDGNLAFVTAFLNFLQFIGRDFNAKEDAIALAQASSNSHKPGQRNKVRAKQVLSKYVLRNYHFKTEALDLAPRS